MSRASATAPLDDQEDSASPVSQVPGMPAAGGQVVTVDQATVLATEHFRQGRFAVAAELCRKAMAVCPDHPDALHILGLVERQHGNLERAVELISRSLAVLPDRSGVCTNLATTLKSLGRTDEAIRLYRRAIALLPAAVEPAYNLGLLYYELGRMAEAVPYLRQASKLDPLHGKARYFLDQALNDELLDRQGVRKVGSETRKSYVVRERAGFFRRYLSGPDILEIGFRGYVGPVVPIVDQAIGIDFGYPGYDGLRLPFPDDSQDGVFSSHCLEHIDDYRTAIREWHRVTRVGGHIVIIVPHQYLYEKKRAPPSRWMPDHKRFYTPSSLMREVEDALAPNSYRVRHLADNDLHHDYSLPPEIYSNWCYEIELVIEKIRKPDWDLA